MCSIKIPLPCVKIKAVYYYYYLKQIGYLNLMHNMVVQSCDNMRFLQKDNLVIPIWRLSFAQYLVVALNNS